MIEPRTASALACDPFHARVPAFRRAEPCDARAIAILQDVANDGQMRIAWLQEGLDWRDVGAEQILSGQTEMALPNTMVATIGDEIVGFLNYASNDEPPVLTDPVGAPFAALRRRLGPCLYLRAMAVDENYRGRGIASRLLDIAEQAAMALGAGSLGVIVQEGNRDLLTHYQRRGFAEVAREPVREHVAYPIGSDLIALRKTTRVDA